MATITAKETVNVYSAKIDEIDSRGANKLTVDMPYSTNIVEGDLIEYYTKDDIKWFKGKVFNIKTFGSKNITAYDLSYSKRIVNEIFTGQSPEYILEYIVTNYTDMTYVATFVSGFTIDVQPFIDTDVMDAIKQILDVLEADYDVDLDGNFDIIKSGSVTSSFNVSITTSGSNAILDEEGWESDAEDKVSKIILIGDKATYQKSDSFTATASQTEFDLTYKPTGSMRVTKNGTELTPQEAGTTTGDYYRDDANQKMYLTTGATLSDAIVVLYDYQKDIRVEIGTGIDIGMEKIFTKKYIKSYQEGRKLAKTLANYYTVTASRAKLTVPDYSQFFNLKPNYKIKVNDQIRSVQKNLIISKKTYEYPKGGIKIEVGKNPYDLFDWSKETQQRIKDLESVNQNNTILQKYRFILEELNVSVIELSVTKKTRTVGNSFIVGHPTNGTVGTTYEIGWQGSDWS